MTFNVIRGLDFRVSLDYFYDAKPLTSEEQERRFEYSIGKCPLYLNLLYPIHCRQFLYGTNAIVIPKHTIAYLLIRDLLNPFYVFQIWSVCLWFADEYYYYAAAIVIMSAGGLITSVYQLKTVLHIKYTFVKNNTVLFNFILRMKMTFELKWRNPIM